MPDASPNWKRARRPRSGLMELLKPYRPLVLLLGLLTILGNALNLIVPKILSRAIDASVAGRLALGPVAVALAVVGGGILILLYFQSVSQTVAAERVARDLRARLVDKIARQDHAYIQGITPATLLTNLTSDVDAVKLFVSQAVATLISSVFLIIGA